MGGVSGSTSRTGSGGGGSATGGASGSNGDSRVSAETAGVANEPRESIGSANIPWPDASRSSDERIGGASASGDVTGSGSVSSASGGTSGSNNGGTNAGGTVSTAGRDEQMESERLHPGSASGPTPVEHERPAKAGDGARIRQPFNGNEA